MRVAVIELALGKVVNVAEVEAGDGSTQPDGFLNVASETANIGDGWDGATIVKTPEPPLAPRS